MKLQIRRLREAMNLVKQDEMLEFMKENIRKLKKGNAADTIIQEMGTIIIYKIEEERQRC